ncbi:MAG: hypothetical protein ACP5IB_09485 [Thermoplasmata archaeon]
MKVRLKRIQNRVFGETSLQDVIKNNNREILSSFNKDYSSFIDKIKELYDKYKEKKDAKIIWEICNSINSFVDLYQKKGVKFENIYSQIRKDLGVSEYTFNHIKKFCKLYPNKKEIKYSFGLYSELMRFSSEKDRKEIEKKIELGEIPPKPKILRKISSQKKEIKN